MIPCYVSGKGKDATARTRNFKQTVIRTLQRSGLGYDTKFRFYQAQFPDLAPDRLIEMVCDPSEYYDKEWKSYLESHKDRADEEEILARFISERDALFRSEAAVAIYCYDEAGLGSGINSMRFIHEGKRILGFYNPEVKKFGVNLTNIIQLKIDYPRLVTLVPYTELGGVVKAVESWLRGLDQSGQKG